VKRTADRLAVTVGGDDIERRARRVPWGIEIQVWQRTNTITVPETALSGLPASSLLDPLSTVGGTLADAVPPSEFDEDTLDMPPDEDTLDMPPYPGFSDQGKEEDQR
jgi:hypothetical protein